MTIDLFPSSLGLLELFVIIVRFGLCMSRYLYCKMKSYFSRFCSLMMRDSISLFCLLFYNYKLCLMELHWLWLFPCWMIRLSLDISDFRLVESFDLVIELSRNCLLSFSISSSRVLTFLPFAEELLTEKSLILLFNELI